MKNLIKKSPFFGIYIFIRNIVERFKRWPRRGGATILLYHRIADVKDDPRSLCVSKKKFERQIVHLKKNYHVVSLGELTSSLKNKSLQKKTVSVTFDDGYYDNLANALPILEKYGVPATIFVTAGHIKSGQCFPWDVDVTAEDRGRPLTVDELKVLASSRFIEIGAHTVSHERLATLSKDEQEKEMRKSKEDLEQIINKPVVSFAYPFGTERDFNPDSVDVAKNVGFVSACANISGYADYHSDIMTLPRNIVRNWSLCMFKFFAL